MLQVSFCFEYKHRKTLRIHHLKSNLKIEIRGEEEREKDSE